MDSFACHGDILYAPSAEKIETYANHWIVVEEGMVTGIFSALPERYAGIEQRDYSDSLIIPAFSDLHIHASQYFQRGVGMDKLLFDWLNDYTFPQEARFSDTSYARAAYGALMNEFIRYGTFHASLFATIHTDSTGVLFDLLEEKGISAFVGKVNMDLNSPTYC
jgi:guanine deaminase